MMRFFLAIVFLLFVISVNGQNSSDEVNIRFPGVRLGVQKIDKRQSSTPVLTATSRLWFTQKLDHFDRANLKPFWQQVNKLPTLNPASG